MFWYAIVVVARKRFMKESAAKEMAVLNLNETVIRYDSEPKSVFLNVTFARSRVKLLVVIQQ